MGYRSPPWNGTGDPTTYLSKTIMNRSLSKKPDNSVKGGTSSSSVGASSLGQNIRAMQSESDRYPVTAEGEEGMGEEKCGFNDSGDSCFNNFDFSGFSNTQESNKCDFSGFTDKDFSGFSDDKDSSNLNLNFNGFSGKDSSGGRRRNNRSSINNRDCIRVGTWNVRTMNQSGKFEEVEKEVKRLKMSICGLSEVRWIGAGEAKGESSTFYYSGGDRHERGVGIMVTKEVEKSVLGYWAVSERVIMMKVKGHPFNMNFIQVYAPTTESSEEEVDEFYEELEEAWIQCKSQEVTLVMGDFNAKVGKGRFENVVGPYGLGDRNYRGERLISWSDANNLLLVNTWFRKHQRHLWTWKSPGDNHRNQIDYIAINQRFRNSVLDAKTFPGADCYSDHVPVVAVIKLKLKKLIRRKVAERLNLKLLQTDNLLKERYRIEVENRYEILNNE